MLSTQTGRRQHRPQLTTSPGEPQGERLTRNRSPVLDWQTSEDTVPSGTDHGGRRAPASRAPARDRRVARGRRRRRPPLRGHRRLPHEAVENCPAASPTRRGASSPRRATTRCWCCTRSPATATSWPGRARASERRMVADIVGPGARSTPTGGSSSPRTCSAAARARPGPRRLAPTATSGASRFPYLTIRDQVAAQVAFADALGIDMFAAVVGGSMGAMHVLEWAIMAPRPRRAHRGPAGSAGEHRRPDRTELGAARGDPHRPAFRGGEYYDAPDGDGPTAGLALARRMALLNYRTADRAEPAVRARLAVRPRPARRRRPVRGRVLPRLPRQPVHAPVRREQLHRAHRGHELPRHRPRPRRRRGGARPRDRDDPRARHRQRPVLPVDGQFRIARGIRTTLDGGAVVLASDFGHDGFLIETHAVGAEATPRDLPRLRPVSRCGCRPTEERRGRVAPDAAGVGVADGSGVLVLRVAVPLCTGGPPRPRRDGLVLPDASRCARVRRAPRHRADPRACAASPTSAVQGDFTPYGFPACRPAAPTVR